MARAARLTTWGVGLSVGLSLVCFALSVAVAPEGPLGVVLPGDVVGGVLALESGALASLGVRVLMLAPLARLLGMGVQLEAEGRPRLAAGALLIVALLLFSLGRLLLIDELPPPAAASTAPVESAR